MIFLEPGKPNGKIAMTRDELRELLEYSSSLPTGTTPGKTWKRRMPDGSWWRGLYGNPYPEGHEFHGQIPINWKPIVVIGEEPRARFRVPSATLCRGLA